MREGPDTCEAFFRQPGKRESRASSFCHSTVLRCGRRRARPLSTRLGGSFAISGGGYCNELCTEELTKGSGGAGGARRAASLTSKGMGIMGGDTSPSGERVLFPGKAVRLIEPGVWHGYENCKTLTEVSTAVAHYTRLF